MLIQYFAYGSNMTAFPRIFIASLALGSAASAAQYPYQYPYPQGQYPQNYPYGYPNQPGGIGGAIIDQLLGRYQVNDRQAIRQCANAAVRQAQNQYRGYGQYGTPGVPYGYDQQYAQPYGYGSNMTLAVFFRTALSCFGDVGAQFGRELAVVLRAQSERFVVCNDFALDARRAHAPQTVRLSKSRAARLAGACGHCKAAA